MAPYTCRIRISQNSRIIMCASSCHQPEGVPAHSSSSETCTSSHQQQTAHQPHLSTAEASEAQGHCPCYALDCAKQGMPQGSQLLLCSWHTVLQPVLRKQINTVVA